MCVDTLGCVAYVHVRFWNFAQCGTHWQYHCIRGIQFNTRQTTLVTSECLHLTGVIALAMATIQATARVLRLGSKQPAGGAINDDSDPSPLRHRRKPTSLATKIVNSYLQVLCWGQPRCKLLNSKLSRDIKNSEVYVPGSNRKT